MVYHTILSLEHIMPWTSCSNGTQHLMVCIYIITYKVSLHHLNLRLFEICRVWDLPTLFVFFLIGDELLRFVLFWSVLNSESHTLRHCHIHSVCLSLFILIVFFSHSLFLRLGAGWYWKQALSIIVYKNTALLCNISSCDLWKKTS